MKKFNENKVHLYNHSNENVIKIKMTQNLNKYLVFIQTELVDLVGFIDDDCKKYIFIGNDQCYPFLSTNNLFYCSLDGCCPDFLIDDKEYGKVYVMDTGRATTVLFRKNETVKDYIGKTIKLGSCTAIIT